VYLTNVERLEKGLIGPSDVPDHLLEELAVGPDTADFSSMTKTEISQYAKEVYGELISTSMSKDEMIVAIEAIAYFKAAK
jgi:hypothetical protein